MIGFVLYSCLRFAIYNFMANRKLKLIFLVGALGCLMLNSSCESANNTPTAIPNFEIACTHTACNGAVTGQGFVLLMKSNCPDPGESSFEPTATGNTALTCTGSGCSGTVTAWSDPNNNSASEIISGTYQICAYVDVNGNLAEESGEPEHESSRVITDPTTVTLDSWSLVP